MLRHAAKNKFCLPFKLLLSQPTWCCLAAGIWGYSTRKSGSFKVGDRVLAILPQKRHQNEKMCETRKSEGQAMSFLSRRRYTYTTTRYSDTSRQLSVLRCLPKVVLPYCEYGWAFEMEKTGSKNAPPKKTLYLPSWMFEMGKTGFQEDSAHSDTLPS